MSALARSMAAGWVLALVACTSSSPAKPVKTAEASALASPPPAEPRAEDAPDAAAPGLVTIARSPLLGQEALRDRFAVFPQALTPIVPMGEEIVAHQVPMTLAYFDTKAGANDILEFYAKEFKRRGWSWIGIEDSRKVVDHPAISATDPETDTQMSVVVMSNGKGEPNTVILGLADVRPEARVPENGDLPPYPGSAPIVLQATELGARAFSQTLTTSDPPARVVAFYLERMQGLGYARLSAGSDEGDSATQLAFAKQGRVWRIRVAQQKDQTVVFATSNATEKERP